MSGEVRQSRLELVDSLASSIRKKLVEPAEGRVKLVDCEIKDLKKHLEDLEQKVTLLAARNNRTRLLAGISLAAAVLLILCQIFSYLE